MPSPSSTPDNRSLLRGIEILRAFRPGAEILGNGEISERTGLARATVTRLAKTLVACGYLRRDDSLRAYRLGAPVLSLGHAMRSGSSLLAVATPLMQSLAISRRINVGIAVPDRDEMVYLESFRYSTRVSLRRVVSGQRVPMELTSLGRAWLAIAPETERNALMILFARRRPSQWPVLKLEIEEAIESVRKRGVCVASWQPEVVALATPLAISGRETCVLNLSLSTKLTRDAVSRAMRKPLLQLAETIRTDLAKYGPDGVS